MNEGSVQCATLGDDYGAYAVTVEQEKEERRKLLKTEQHCSPSPPQCECGNPAPAGAVQF